MTRVMTAGDYLAWLRQRPPGHGHEPLLATRSAPPGGGQSLAEIGARLNDVQTRQQRLAAGGEGDGA